MDHFLRQDAADAETQAADIFQQAVERERETAVDLVHGRGVHKGYAEMAKDEDSARTRRIGMTYYDMTYYGIFETLTFITSTVQQWRCIDRY